MRPLLNDTPVNWRSESYNEQVHRLIQGRATLEDPRSHDWLNLLALSKNQDILVLGIGEGLLPLTLAGQCRSVTVIDIAGSDLNILAKRCREDGTKNIKFDHSRALDRLKGVFDLIIVSDWPSEGIEPSLKKLAALCTKDGWICFSILNRFSPSSFLQSRKTNSKIPIVFKKRLLRLLADTGFSQPQLYAQLPKPGNVPLFYVPLDHNGAWQYFLRNLFPLFALASPEIKQRYRLEYGAAKLAIKISTLFRMERALLPFLPGYLTIAQRARA